MNIAMFGPLDWQGTWYSRHHLTIGLASRHQVTVIGEGRHVRSLLRHPGTAFRGAQVRRDMHAVLRFEPPGWLPHLYGSWFAATVVHRLRARAVRRLVAPSLRYVWHPDYEAAAAGLDDVPLVYHCYDKYDRYTNAVVSHVREQESRLASRAALCVAASTKLGEHLAALGARNILVLRHGVDARHFRPGGVAPPSLDSIPRPRLGVVARLNEALDLAVLEEVAAARPSWSLVLVGGAHFDDPRKGERFATLCRRPNVYHVGPQPQAEIPRWLSGLDVGLACYDLATWGPYNQPIKLYEYLACGLSVVSSDILAARELGDLVERCGTVADWVPAIERALASQAPAVQERRLAFARDNTWDRRVEELDQALRALPGVDSTT
jgi:glycosyltransferase involved in cell wall biosynthesis